MVVWICTLKSPPGDVSLLEQAEQGTTNKVHACAFERICFTDLINFNEISKWKLANGTEAVYQMSETSACSLCIYVILLHA